MRTTSVGLVCLMMALGACDGVEPEASMATEAEAALAEASPEGPVERLSVDGARVGREVALSGRVTFDGADDMATANAWIIVQPLADGEDPEAPPAAGFRHAAIETHSDGNGFFSLATLPAGVTSADLSIYVDDELAHSERLVVENGRVPKLIGVAIALGVWGLCIAATWASAANDLPGANDKLKHCVASCRAQRWCGGSIVAGVLKEILDTVCQAGPTWLANLLKSAQVSGCTGWDNADLAADTAGIACAFKWKTCMNCCDAIY